MIVPNSVGVLAASYYVLTYSQHVQDSTEFTPQVLGVISCVTLGVVLAFLMSMASAVGSLAGLLNIVMLASPLQTIPEVIKTGDVSSLGTSGMATAGFVCSLAWFVNGFFYLETLAVWVPNAIGLVVNIVSLALFFKMGGSKKQN